MKRVPYTIVPAVAALAALFLVLPSQGSGTEVEMTRRGSRYGYAPQNLSIEAGEAITFHNESRATHTATCDRCPWDTGDLQPGQMRTLRFDRPGRYTFFCRYHALSDGMIGRLEVRPQGTEPSPTASPAGDATASPTASPGG